MVTTLFGRRASFGGRGFGAFIAALLVWGSLPGPAEAVIAQFNLHNHPDGSARPPLYGMRLDGLFGGDATDWTFDFGHPSSDMKLHYDTIANTIRIFGTVFGGLDTGTDYDTSLSGLWAVDFNYLANVGGTYSVADPESVDLLVSAASSSNSGTITPQGIAALGAADGVPISLIDFMDPSFHFRDGVHRGFDGIAGWGWLNHSGRDHVADSDWLFTATFDQHMPEPISAAVWGVLGLFGLAWMGVRRRGRCHAPVATNQALG